MSGGVQGMDEANGGASLESTFAVRGARRTVRRRAWAMRCAALGAGLVLLAGCVLVKDLVEEPISAEDAVAHYDAVAGAVVEELSGAEWTPQENPREVRVVDGECRYLPGAWYADSRLDGVSGDEGWDEITERRNPVLAEHGFGAFSAPKRSGALYSVSSQDEHGAELELGEQGWLSLRGALVDAEPCTAEALGL